MARFEIGGGDEVANGVAYVRFNPATGATQVTKITGPPLDYDPNPYLLVDAGRTLAVRANSATIKEEDNGTMKLYPIDGGKARTVDLRKLTGVATLHPIGWAFDPTQAGLLRVLDRSGRLFEYDVAADTVTEADKVAVEKGYELAPMFDSATGMPLLRNKDTWEYQKGGAYTAGGVTVVQDRPGLLPGHHHPGPHHRRPRRHGVRRLPGRADHQAVPAGQGCGRLVEGRRLRRRRAPGHDDDDVGAAHRGLTGPYLPRPLRAVADSLLS